VETDTAEVSLVVNLQGIDQVNAGFRSVGESAKCMGVDVAQVSGAMDTASMSAKDTALSVNNLATAGMGLYMSVERISYAETALDRANLAVRRSTENVERAQEAYNKAVSKYGPDSREAKEAADKLSIAQDALKISQERALDAQNRMNTTMVTSALTVVPSLITAATSLGKIWTGLPDMVGKVTEGIGSLGISANTALIGMAALVGTFTICSTVLSSLSPELRGIVAPIMAVVAAIVVATVAWMAFQGTITMGIAVPIILAAVGMGIAAIKSMIGFAEGGIVTQPTVGLLGEAGPEAVLPLSRLSEVAMRGPTTINITINESKTPEETGNATINSLRRAHAI